MTSHIPAVTVLLDDGTGTYPIDISGRVNLSASIGTQGHGRTDEFAQAAATTFSCTLKNDDGFLSSGGSPLFGGGGFGGGGFGGGITLTPGQGIRYQQTFGATTVNRFTGRISEAALGFTSVGKASAMAITAVDPLASLARRPLRSMLEQEILLDQPTAYYTLGEAEGSTSAGDTSGNGNSPLTTVGTVQFGNGIGPTDGLTAATFTGAGYLAGDASLLSTPGGIAFAMGTTATSVDLGGWLLYDGIGSSSYLLRINSTGHLELVDAGTILGTSSITVNDGLTHFIEWNRGLFGPLDSARGVWVDGSQQITANPSLIGSTFSNLRFGGGVGPDAGTKFSGTLSHISIGDETSPSRIAARAAVAEGFTETTAARFTRLASYVGMTVSTPANSGQLVGAQDTSGANALDALQTVATSEGGVMFANGSGTLVMQGRGYRAQNITADLTIAGKDIDVGTTVPLDDQQIVNQVTVSRQGGATQTYPTDLSLGSVDRFPQSLDLIVTSDGDALAAAQWLATKHATSIPRIGSATVKLLTSSQAEQLMAAEIGDRWALSAMPTQLWANAGDLSLEGWSETLTVTLSSAEWSMTANLLPFSIFAAALYDDAGSLYDTAGDVYAY